MKREAMAMTWTNGIKRRLDIKVPLESVNLIMVNEFVERQRHSRDHNHWILRILYPQQKKAAQAAAMAATEARATSAPCPPAPRVPRPPGGSPESASGLQQMGGSDSNGGGGSGGARADG